MTTAEVIAQLDAMERSLEMFSLKLRTLRQDLLDSIESEMVQ